METSILPEMIDVSTLQTWDQANLSVDEEKTAKLANPNLESNAIGEGGKRESPFQIDSSINAKISLFRGDPLALQVDAVVNATSEQFNDRSLLTRRIMQLAGPELPPAIARLEGCRTGEVCAM